MFTLTIYVCSCFVKQSNECPVPLGLQKSDVIHQTYGMSYLHEYNSFEEQIAGRLYLKAVEAAISTETYRPINAPYWLIKSKLSIEWTAKYMND